jgi:hypothetical protein
MTVSYFYPNKKLRKITINREKGRYTHILYAYIANVFVFKQFAKSYPKYDNEHINHKRERLKLKKFIKLVSTIKMELSNSMNNYGNAYIKIYTNL